MKRPGQRSSIGARRHLVGFFKQKSTDDGYGNEVLVFEDDPDFTTAAAVTAKFGGEAIHAERLTGVQSYTIVVRQSSRTREVDATWKAKDMREGMEFSIRSGPVDPDDSGRDYEFLCQTGVAP